MLRDEMKETALFGTHRFRLDFMALWLIAK